MRRFLLGFALALMAPVSAFAMDFPVSATVSGDSALWEAPNSQASTIGTVPDGTAVTITACRDAWCAVSAPGIEGHVTTGRLVLDNGQTARDTLRAEIQPIEPYTEFVVVLRDIWTEGDSYMFGELTSLIGRATGRPVETTAVGGSDMATIASRLESGAKNSRTKRVTVIWDGSHNGLSTPARYVERQGEGIAALGHDHFIVIPALHGDRRDEVAAEIGARWPDNTLDWRTVLGDYDGDSIPTSWLKNPDTDQVHLSTAAKAKVADAIARFIRAKGW